MWPSNRQTRCNPLAVVEVSQVWCRVLFVVRLEVAGAVAHGRIRHCVVARLLSSAAARAGRGRSNRGV